MAKRISPKNVGQQFNLRFVGSPGTSEFDTNELIKVEGEGDNMRATFRASFGDWEAYRWNGAWRYGSSADRLTVQAD